MKLQTGGELGIHMGKMAGKLDLLWNITDVIQFISSKLEETELWKQLIFFQKKITLPFPSPQDLATQAAVDLTHALLHPQPAGPFCKVGDTQTIALKRLADIFEGATRRKTKIVVPPTEKEDNNAPPRVQPVVSPPRVPNTTAHKMSPQQHIKTHSTPNSHRRRRTPAKRAVTPQTPHVMV
jgi:hypothetical protein